jgi:hypothetical protein
MVYTYHPTKNADDKGMVYGIILPIYYLVGGLEHVLFSIILGIVIPPD